MAQLGISGNLTSVKEKARVAGFLPIAGKFTPKIEDRGGGVQTFPGGAFKKSAGIFLDIPKPNNGIFAHFL